MLDKKLKVTLGGLKQKIHIKTDDEKKPVLLFLHGGPGVCNRHAIMQLHADLMDTFTLVAWDQRGSGGSYWSADPKTFTIKRFTDDAAELAEWLCGRFKKDKIFIIGGSWGSALGTWLAYRYPKRIAAYVGFGQVVNIAESERLSYEFALNAAKEAGDTESVKKLEELGPPVMGVYKGAYTGAMVQRRVMMKYGGYSKNEGRRNYWDSTFKPMLFSGEYSISDFIGFAFGHKKVLNVMWPEVGTTDFPKTCTAFKVPYFIFDGRLDQNTPSVLVQDYFDGITAPRKELIWFEDSGHNPMTDEPDKFKTLLRQKLTEIAAKEANV